MIRTIRRTILVFAALASAYLPAAVATAETEPNDTKAQANLIALPVASAVGVITGNSQAPSAFDFFRVTTATQPLAGFYRHRLTLQFGTNPAGLIVTIRGLTQLSGVITPASDTTVQTSSSAAGDRFVQWYTSQAAADLYVRVTGISTTVADYSVDYEVTAANEIVGPTIGGGSRTISTIGQTTVNTDLWVYDGTRTAIANSGNDDESVLGGGTGTTSQSLLTRSYGLSTFYLAISRDNLANSLASPADDDQRNGNVLDFPGAVATTDDASTSADLDVVIDGTLVQPVPVPPRQVVFISFSVTTPVDLLEFGVE